MPDLPIAHRPFRVKVRKHESPNNGTKRTRGRKLQENRKRLFSQFPLCVLCYEKGIVKEATERDHIVPLFKGGADDDTNVQALCSKCHREKTKKDLQGRSSK